MAEKAAACVHYDAGADGAFGDAELDPVQVRAAGREEPSTGGSSCDGAVPRMELTMPTAWRLSRLSSHAAQANSVAKMASPAGMTISAGPGVISMMIPMSATVLPTMKMTMRLAVR